MSVLLCLGVIAAACSGADDSVTDTATDTDGDSPPQSLAVTGAETTAQPGDNPAGATPTPPPDTSSAPTSEELDPQRESEAEEQRQPATEDSQLDSDDPLSAVVLTWMAETGTPGVVMATARGGEAPTTLAWGVADIKAETPMTADHHVFIGSVTKPATAAVVLQLADEGLVELDAPVAGYLGPDWVPGYAHAADVTVRDLIGHTSGLAEFPFSSAFAAFASTRLDEVAEPTDLIALMARSGPAARLHRERHYSTTGYLAAGLLIEAVTGNAAAAELAQRVFEPIGLDHTYLPPGSWPPEPIATGYIGGEVADFFEGELDLGSRHTVEHNGEELLDTGTFPQTFAHTAGWVGGGLSTRIGDAAQLMRGIFGGVVLDDSQVELMTAPHPNAASEHGLGISTVEVLGQSVYVHGGVASGFQTIAAYVPLLDLGIAITINLLGLELPNDVSDLLQRLAPLLATFV